MLLVALALMAGLLGCNGSRTDRSSAASSSSPSTNAASSSGAGSASSGAASASGSATSTKDASSASTSSSSTPSPATTKTAVEKGALAPDFSYTTVDGKSGRLSELKGKAVLLNFWASWCGPCVREMPDIAKLKADYPALEVLAINVSDDPAGARDFIAKTDYGFTWAIDEQGKISAKYPTDGIPYTIIIGTDGVIGAIFLGSPADVYGSYEHALKQAGLT
jgi:thiol-disulfide isomerase/thioredoxin